MKSHESKSCRIAETVVTWGLVLASCASLMQASETSKWTEDLRRQTQADVARPKTAILRQEVSETYTPVVDYRERHVERILQARDEITQRALAEGSGETVLTSLEASLSNCLAMADSLARVHELNASTVFGRRLLLDFTGQRARMEEEDCRDVDALLAVNNLEPQFRRSLSRTRVCITSLDGCKHMPEEEDGLVVISEMPQFNADMEHHSLGLIPGWFFADERLVRVARSGKDADGPFVDVNCRFTDKKADVLRFRVRPERGYRIEQWKTYHDNGQLAEDQSFEDYRCVNGVWLPFKTCVRRHDDQGQVTFRLDTRLLSAEVNTPLDEALFEIPEGMRVQDIRAAEITAQ